MREFELIEAVRQAAEKAARSGSVRVGIGDDCCVLQPLGPDELVLSTDAVVEDVHFRLRYFDFFQVGARAAAAALSDLAAMSAEPVGMLAAVAIDSGRSESALPEIARGLIETGARYGCPLIGGDLTASPGPVIISLTVAGRLPKGASILRSGAAPGQAVWVTGEPGEAAAVLEYLERESRGQAKGLPEPDKAALERFYSPQPRIPEARRLRESGPPASMIDISDGLAADLGHILAASGVGAELIESDLPLGRYSGQLARALGLPINHFMFQGGEDYELCLTAPSGCLNRAARELEKAFGTRLTRIGVTTGESGGLYLRHPDGGRTAMQSVGYEHFA